MKRENELENQAQNKPERDEKGRLLPGNTANPEGRPKGKTLKEFAREYYQCKDDEEKVKYISDLERRVPGFAWRMAEGNPSNTTELSGKDGAPIQFEQVSDAEVLNEAYSLVAKDKGITPEELRGR